MDKIRWYEFPEARQLASLGKRLSKAGQQRLHWMLFYSFNGRNVARTCRHFSISRQTFYRWWRRFDRHDLRTLEARSHRTHHEEFYQVHADSHQPPALNRQLRHWEHTYNCVRPHQSLAYLTPLEFVTRWKQNLRKASVTNLLDEYTALTSRHSRSTLRSF